MLFSILFVLAFSTQRAVEACEVCGAAGYAPTVNATKIDVGAQYWYCPELVSRSNEFNNDTCLIVQSLALKNCGCQNVNRNPLPAAPINLTTMCNICGGPNGSDLHAPKPAQWNANVGALGDTKTCGFFYQNALQGAFGGQDNINCITLQESTRAICGCEGPGW
jgi:hypothetical protein